MSGLALHPGVLWGLHLNALVRAFLKYRNPRRRKSGRHHAAFYEHAWSEAAAQLGASCEPLGAGFLEISLDGVRTRVIENTCALEDPVAQALAGHKGLTYKLLERCGLPTARHAEFTLKSVHRAATFLDEVGRDCVVKPAAGTGGGRGTTTGIRSRRHLAAAAAAAAVYGDELLIEEQVDGANYRLLYLDGQLLDAFRRDPPSVRADGRSTVRELVQKGNDERLRQGYGLSQVLLTIDLDMQQTLAKQGLSLRSVPPEGTAVVLKTVVNENLGAENTSAMGRLCDSVVADGARAAKALGVRLAGVDVITPDPGVPLAEAGGVILEVNTTPNYYYHYYQRDGVFPVAVHVLRKLLLEGHPAARVEGEEAGPVPLEVSGR